MTKHVKSMWLTGRKVKGICAMQNPYWIAYRNVRTNEKKRYMLNAGLTYDILDWLNVSARIRVDNTDNTYQQKLIRKYDLYTDRR